MNTEELKKLALAATPGPWIAEVSWQSTFLEGKHDGKWVIRKSNTSFGFAPLAYVKGDKRITDGDGALNAQFIAAANPATILALIAERDELLAALKDARRELAYAGRQEAHDAASAAIAKGGEV